MSHFFVSSTRIRVTDPCYERTEDDSKNCCIKILENVLPGVWQVNMNITSDTHGWGDRVESLEIFANAPGHRLDHREQLEGSICVDSGQAGFFDDAFFPKGDVGEYDDLNSFYGLVCNQTLDDDGRTGGLANLGFGVASSSGYGDGEYPLYVSRDDKGVIIGCRIVFIEEDYDEDFEEDSYEDYEEDYE